MFTIAIGGDELAVVTSWSPTLGAAGGTPDAKHVAKQKTPAVNTPTERRGGFIENTPFDLHESITKM
jgi:hypothetical protein